jgi:putative aldouronate transport system permease protein
VPLAWYVVMHYVPIYGLQIAFKNFVASRGIWGSPWVGLKHFERFFKSYYFGRLLGNTFGISLYALAVGFPAPILLALMMNELKSVTFKRIVQNVTYVPHFLSVVVVVGMILTFTNPRYGIVNIIAGWAGAEPVNYMIRKEWFKTIFVLTNVWQEMGWNAIIYMAALAGLDPALYEAATVDGATRARKIWHISLPGIMPTIIILLILRVGSILNVAFQKILLMQNGLNLETSDVISTYVYRAGILQGDYSFSSAVGLFRSLLNLVLLVAANQAAKRLRQTTLW